MTVLLESTKHQTAFALFYFFPPALSLLHLSGGLYFLLHDRKCRSETLSDTIGFTLTLRAEKKLETFGKLEQKKQPLVEASLPHSASLCFTLLHSSCSRLLYRNRGPLMFWQTPNLTITMWDLYQV